MTDQDYSRVTRAPLLPDRHPEPDFFSADIFDATPKADQAGMEHPLFTLSTKPDMTIRDYRHGETFVKLSPSPIGRATVHDRDILIYCISQCMARLNEGRPVLRRMRFNPHDLMITTNRDTSGRGYLNFKQALIRLQGTQIETNITMGGKSTWKVFSFIESAEIVRETFHGRMQEVEISLSDWLFDAIEVKGRDLLTLSRGYFRLRKPLERRLYEISRKHCGKQRQWRCSLRRLQEKTGSQSTSKEFKRLINKIIQDNQAHQHIPEYDFILEGQNLLVTRRLVTAQNSAHVPFLSASVRETAKQLAPGWDVDGLIVEWAYWIDSKSIKVRDANAHFLAFCKQKGPFQP